MTSAGPASSTTLIPPRARRLRRRVLIFSLLSALTAVLVGGIVFSVANVYIPVRELQETNQKTFERIHCDGQSCDVGEIASDWEFTGADYVLDKETYFLLNVEEPTADF